jgi:diguanylate cyclase (GGDEF)-like protein
MDPSSKEADAEGMELTLDSSMRSATAVTRPTKLKDQRVIGPRETRRHPSGGVTTRLIALVMLPVTAMCVLAGSVTIAHRSAAAQAVAIEQGVVGLGDLLEIRDGLHSLQSAAAFDIRYTELGITREVATTFIGFDWATQIGPARASISAAIASLGADSPVGADAFRAFNTSVDSAVITQSDALDQLVKYIALTGAAMTTTLNRLEGAAHRAPMLVALKSLRAASTLVDSATPQVIDLSAVWYPSPSETPETSSALVRFATDSANYAEAESQLRELGEASIIAGLDQLESDPQVRAFEQSVANTLNGQDGYGDGAVPPTEVIAATFRGYAARDLLLDGLIGSAATTVRDEARQLATAEERSLVLWALGSLGMALVSVGIALWLARSISRPLKDLASYAHKVNEGKLDAEPSSRRNHGPRETQMAFATFTELVANLQLLDAKANALAHCDFDDPVLQEPLPGRLGRSLESSVALLSGSIVERDQLQTRLAYQATHDSLTRIGNRPAAIAAIEVAMQRADRTGATIAVLFIDLNDFKAVNDSYGHRVGDEVLRYVATRLTLDLRRGDFLARLGGDEFVVVADGIDGVAEATDLARRIIDTLTRPIEFDGMFIRIGASVGVALALDGPEDPLRLLARADAAMYRAKLHETSAIELFDADLQREMVEREDVESALSMALADPTGGGLELQYQPVLDAGSGVLVGVEALIRWNRPGHGLQQPDAFIPVAEATSLIIDLDCWVLNEATRQLVAWSTTQELADIPVAVNISGRHLLSRQLPGHIREALDRTGIAARRLSIEITETVLLSDLVSAAAQLDEIRALGVKVAIDDFGTGYTSLAHLQQLPIDTLKIDRSFISQLDAHRGNSLVRMVTDLGHAIDVNIVAEGVETSGELTALQVIGADCVQGWLLSAALKPDALSAWVRQRTLDAQAAGLLG